MYTFTCNKISIIKLVLFTKLLCTLINKLVCEVVRWIEIINRYINGKKVINGSLVC